MKHFLTFLFFTVELLFIGCQKGDKLPEPTTEGLNTFACKINGKVWIANGISTGNKSLEVELSK